MKLKTLIKTLSETRYRIWIRTKIPSDPDSEITNYELIEIDYLSQLANTEKFLSSINKRNHYGSATVYDISYNKTAECIEISADAN